ncbi:MAG: hypothetical protein K9L17_05840 [Clostridiales bacterium]|nr:hypothetical protein [Clostridiales bacterium]MCF8022193.1 hypothetical protein [Clostridiales bacterium]
MFTGTVIITIITFLLLFLSIRERVRLTRYREKDWDVIGEGKSSPLSRALTSLVGTAGGIYLSVILLITFLEFQIPERIDIGVVRIEPIAAISIILAILQPFILRVIESRKRL